jgi:hypothetical protein
MIAIKALVAANEHPNYPPGLQAQAHIFVDTDDWVEAEERAKVRLAEFGWSFLSAKDSLRIPNDSDSTSWSSNMAEAFRQAKEHGVAHVAYPASAT